jgi:hypothetical protein
MKALDQNTLANVSATDHVVHRLSGFGNDWTQWALIEKRKQTITEAKTVRK